MSAIWKAVRAVRRNPTHLDRLKAHSKLMNDDGHLTCSNDTSYVLNCLIGRRPATGEPERFFLIEKQ